MKILAIDPGSVESAWLELNGDTVSFARIDNNEALLAQLYNIDPTERVFVFEMVQCFGMRVGTSVFDTVFWIGRFWEALGDVPKRKMYRREVKLYLCNSMQAKDTNIRQVLRDRFGPVGTKKVPGPLYGIKSHLWSALALAVTYADKQLCKENKK